MRAILPLLLACCALAPLSAQTVIDLGPGGGVRSKTLRDYDRQPRPAAELRADSLAWADCLTRAFNELSRDSLAAAARCFREALRLRPDAEASAVIRHNLGRIDLARGDYRSAISLFSALLKDDPSRDDARLDRAKAYLEGGNPSAALSDCDVLLAKGQADTARRELLFLSGAARIKLRLYADARRDLEQALALDPRNTAATLLLALALERDGQPREAVARLSALLEAEPGNLDALLARAATEARQGHYGAARMDYDEALRLDPSEAETYVDRARVLLHLGQKAAARRDLDRARELGVPAVAVQHLYR